MSCELQDVASWSWIACKVFSFSLIDATQIARMVISFAYCYLLRSCIWLLHYSMYYIKVPTLSARFHFHFQSTQNSHCLLLHFASSSLISSFTFRHFSASCSGISLIYSSCCFTFVAFPYCFKINIRHYLLELTFDLFECNLTASITGTRTGARTRATRKSKMLRIGSKGFFQAWMLSHKFNHYLLDIFEIPFQRIAIDDCLVRFSCRLEIMINATVAFDYCLWLILEII